MLDYTAVESTLQHCIQWLVAVLHKIRNIMSLSNKGVGIVLKKYYLKATIVGR
jgi:hypothetical protein